MASSRPALNKLSVCFDVRRLRLTIQRSISDAKPILTTSAAQAAADQNEFDDSVGMTISSTPARHLIAAPSNGSNDERIPLLAGSQTDSKHAETKSSASEAVSSGGGSGGGGGGGGDDPFHNETWEKFARAWNEIVDDLRCGDLINNEEKHLLTFRFIAGASKPYYIPLFVTAGVVDHALESCANAARRFNAAASAASSGSGGAGGGGAGNTPTDEALKKVEIEAELAQYFTDPLIREAISELWELSKWLVLHLLGGRHTADIHQMFNSVFAFLENGYLLKAMDMAAITKIKPLLLSLVRAVRIAHATFKTLRAPPPAAAVIAPALPPPPQPLPSSSAGGASAAAKSLGQNSKSDSPPSANRTLRASAADHKLSHSSSRSKLEVKTLIGGGGGSDSSPAATAGGAGADDDHSPPRRRGRKAGGGGRLHPPRAADTRGLQEGLSRIKKSASSATISMLENLQTNPMYTSVKVISPGAGGDASTPAAAKPASASLAVAPTPVAAAAAAAASPTREEELTTLHVNFLRDQTRNLLQAVSGLVKEFGAGDGKTEIKGRITKLLGASDGFFGDDAYAAHQISELCNRPTLSVTLRTLHTYLTMARIDAEPKQDEARRRLLVRARVMMKVMPFR